MQANSAHLNQRREKRLAPLLPARGLANKQTCYLGVLWSLWRELLWLESGRVRSGRVGSDRLIHSSSRRQSEHTTTECLCLGQLGISTRERRLSTRKLIKEHKQVGPSTVFV